MILRDTFSEINAIGLAKHYGKDSGRKYSRQIQYKDTTYEIADNVWHTEKADYCVRAFDGTFIYLDTRTKKNKTIGVLREVHPETLVSTSQRVYSKDFNNKHNVSPKICRANYIVLASKYPPKKVSDKFKIPVAYCIYSEELGGYLYIIKCNVTGAKLGIVESLIAQIARVNPYLDGTYDAFGLIPMQAVIDLQDEHIIQADYLIECLGVLYNAYAEVYSDKTRVIRKTVGEHLRNNDFTNVKYPYNIAGTFKLVEEGLWKDATEIKGEIAESPAFDRWLNKVVVESKIRNHNSDFIKDTVKMLVHGGVKNAKSMYEILARLETKGMIFDNPTMRYIYGLVAGLTEEPKQLKYRTNSTMMALGDALSDLKEKINRTIKVIEEVVETIVETIVETVKEIKETFAIITDINYINELKTTDISNMMLENSS